MSESEFPRRHYGRRKGWKLRPRQSGLVETLLPHLTLTPHPGLDPHAYFALSRPSLGGEVEARSASGGGIKPEAAPHPAIRRSAPSAPTSPQGGGELAASHVSEAWFEIGFGGGEHLAAQAAANPSVGIIGAEPFVAGMAKLLSKIEDLGLQNVRLYMEDARDVIAALPDASLGKIFILFPDPWPKARHNKRRFIQMDMLDKLARVLRPGGEFRFASDHADYVSWALERFTAHDRFAWTANGPDDWRCRPPDWPETRYEAKAIAAGRACVYLRFLRR